MRTAMPVTDNGPPARRVGRFEWERALRADDQLKERPHHVALILATYADADGTNVRVGFKTVARDARMAPSTARKHLATLRELGWLRRVSRGSSGGTANDADAHHLTVPVGVVSTRPVDDQAPRAAADSTPRRPDATAAIMPPARGRRSTAPLAAERSSTSTSAHQRAVPTPDQCSPVSSAPTDQCSPASRPVLTSEQTSAHPLAPTIHNQIITNATRAAFDPSAPPRCPACSDQPAGSWGPPCGGCAAIGRAHRALLTDRRRAYARARRACTECNENGWLLGPDGEQLDIRCIDHPTVPPEVWAGDVDVAPPLPPPLEAPPVPEQRSGRHHLPDNVAAPLPPGWRPSPYPRHLADEVLSDAV